MTRKSESSHTAFSRREFLVASGSALLGVMAAPRAFGVVAPGAAVVGNPMSLTQDPLPYAYDALEPIIDAATMEIHFGRHHAGYVNNLHRAIREEPALQGKLLEQMLADLAGLPEAVRDVVRNNGGGHYNHALFWEWMSPDGGGEPEGALREAIDRELGGLDAFKQSFASAAANRFGSGWAWLVVNEAGHLEVGSTPNQDNPLMKGVSSLIGAPVLGLDVWEHAYYLKYQNRRGDYVQAWWDTVNWAKADELYRAASGTIVG